MVLDLQAAGSAARADRPFATQRDRDDHRLLAKLHVPDPRARQPEHPVICRRDSHAALLHRPLELNSQQPAEDGAAAGRPRRAQLARPSPSPERERRGGAARRASSGSHSCRTGSAKPYACRGFGRLTRASAPLLGNDRRAEPGTPQVNDPTAPVPTKSPPIWRSGCQGGSVQVPFLQEGLNGGEEMWLRLAGRSGRPRVSRRSVSLIFGDLPKTLFSSHVRCLKSSTAGPVAGCSWGCRGLGLCANAGRLGPPRQPQRLLSAAEFGHRWG